MEKGKFIAAGVAVATIGGVLAHSEVTNAHAPDADANCYGLEVNFQDYEGGPNNNELTIVVNGVEQTLFFGGSYQNTFPWSGAEDHTWSVAVDANLNSGHPTQWGWGTDGFEEACEEPTTTTTTSSTTTTMLAPTTTGAPTTTTETPTTTDPVPATTTTVPHTVPTLPATR